MKSYLKILIVEDSIIFAQGLELLLEQHPLIQSICTVCDFDSTLNKLKKDLIDVIILDLNFDTKEYDGFIIAKKVKQLYPYIKIMVLTQHTRISHYNRLFNECNVDAYLDKQLGIDETFYAINKILNGEKYIDNNISEMLDIEEWIKASARETDVIDLLIEGLTQKEIGDKLFISSKTVEVHVRNLFDKFDVKNSVQLVAKYLKYKNANREGGDRSIAPFKNI